MNTTTSNPFFRFYCNVFGHQYKVTKKVTSHVKEYQCKCCKHELTTNSNGRLTELTPTFKEINAILERIYNSKMLRIKKQHEVITTSLYQLKNTA